MAVIRDHDEASAILADAIWWLKGFGAGTSADNEDDVYALAIGLRETRIWLERVKTARVRLLGDDATGSVVITYGEFERLYDGLRGHSAEDDRIGLATAESILAEYRSQVEAIAGRLDEQPF